MTMMVKRPAPMYMRLLSRSRGLLPATPPSSNKTVRFDGYRRRVLATDLAAPPP
jgi:hypothetical protein